MSVAAIRSQVEIQETATQVIVTVQIPQIPTENLQFHLAPQALLLWGERLERVKIDGYCDFSYPAEQFRKLIALPYSVQTEGASAEVQSDEIVFTLLKCQFS